ncbi:MAG: hypothetical protein K9L74_01040 [Candidatus Izimaplasma sp.]|nr:hypothetical protein [Candidatus Izimaplasma bacterium]
MKRLVLFLGVIMMSIMLVGCGSDDLDHTKPTFTSIQIDGQSPISGGSLVTFYKAKQEPIRIDIELNNPDNLEITSIAISGYKFFSTRFLEGSTNQSISFEMNAPSSLGMNQFQITEIVYFVGDNSFNIRDFSNDKFDIYVYKEVPKIERKNYETTKNEILIDFKIRDVDEVIIANTLKAQLFAGETLIEEVIIPTGDLTVVFDRLLTNKPYTIKIKGAYNLDNDQGLQENVVLYSDTYTTLSNEIPTATISNLVVKSNTATFDVGFTDNDAVLRPGGLKVALYKDDEFVKETIITGATENLFFGGLLNDNSYSIRVLANYDLNDGDGIRQNKILSRQTFDTLPKTIPTPQILNLQVTENIVNFDIAIDDIDDLIVPGSLKAILRFEDGVEIFTDIIDNQADFQVNNLFANNAFEIAIIADYDLNDGQGIQTDQLLYTDAFSTIENSAPQVDVGSILVEQGYVTVPINVLDPNNTLINTVEILLLEEGVEVARVTIEPDTEEVIFNYPISYDNNYAIDVIADYNLRDGNGPRYDQKLFRAVLITKERKAPVAELLNITNDTQSISLDITVLDADETITLGTTQVHLYLEGVLVDSKSLDIGVNSVTFDNLLSDNNYDIIVETNYDISTGLVIDQTIARTEVLTDEKELPTAEVLNAEQTETSLEFDVVITDPDEVVDLSSFTVELYHENTVVETLELSGAFNYGVSFSNLLSNNDYKVKVNLNYNLNDGQGTIENFDAVTTTIKTEAQTKPIASVLDQVTTYEQIKLDIEISDPDNVISGNLKAILYQNGEATGQEKLLTEGLNPNVRFTGLYSNASYTVIIVADYDLNEASGPITEGVLNSLSTRTATDVSVTQVEGDLTYNSNALEVYVNNKQGYYVSDNVLIEVTDGVTTIQTYSVGYDSTFNIDLVNLLSNTDYTVYVKADFDTGDEIITDKLISTYAFTTAEITPIDVTFELLDLQTNQISLEIDVAEDVDNYVQDGSLEVVLFQIVDGVKTEIDTQLLPENNTTEVNFNFDPDDGQVVIAVRGIIDRNDGIDPVLEIIEQFFYINVE